MVRLSVHFGFSPSLPPSLIFPGSVLSMICRAVGSLPLNVMIYLGFDNDNDSLDIQQEWMID